MSKLNSNIEFELTNGEVVPLTLTWGLLIQIRSKSKHDYARFSKMVSGGVQDDALGNVAIIYASYLCGYIQERGDLTGCMPESEFVDLVPNDFRLVFETANSLLDPKRARDSENPS